MHRLPRTYFGNPILRTKARKVVPADIRTPRFQKLIRQMFFTMRQVSGVGLAAPQIGRAIQLAVIEIKKTGLRPAVVPLGPTVIVNPVILRRSREQIKDWEGCLSFAGARGLVLRSKKITVRYLDAQGKTKTVEVRGFQARVFQHEIDHLNGTLYVDRMANMTSLMTTAEFRKRVLFSSARRGSRVSSARRGSRGRGALRSK